METAARPTARVRLWVAAAMGDTAAIGAALSAGATIDSLDSQGTRRALNYAALGNRVAAVRLLLARGASINLANRTGFTPVLHAVEGGANEALAVLIEAGADITIAAAGGVTAHPGAATGEPGSREAAGGSGEETVSSAEGG